MFLDPLYFLIVGPFLLLAAFASLRVQTTFRRFSQVRVGSGMTGAQAAAAIARAGGAAVTIERHAGFLSDHYDPRTRTLRLSPDVHDGRSVASIAVAAHEAGHALQHVARYPALAFRSAVVPVASFGSKLWFYLFLLGLLLQLEPLLLAGVVLFALVVLFQIVTLPVEFDASKRAKAMLAHGGIVRTSDEAQGVSRVLGAAAMTYVAAALTSVATLLYLLLRVGHSQDSRS